MHTLSRSFFPETCLSCGCLPCLLCISATFTHRHLHVESIVCFHIFFHLCYFQVGHIHKCISTLFLLVENFLYNLLKCSCKGFCNSLYMIKHSLAIQYQVCWGVLLLWTFTSVLLLYLFAGEHSLSTSINLVHTIPYHHILYTNTKVYKQQQTIGSF